MSFFFNNYCQFFKIILHKKQNNMRSNILGMMPKQVKPDFILFSKNWVYVKIQNSFE